MVINEVQSFGATIRKYRKSQGVTQCQLAARFNDDPLTKSAVYAKIMNNIRRRSGVLFG